MIHVCEPSTTKAEIKWVNKALKENKISSASGLVEKFEQAFAKRIGTKYAVAVNSGTSAIFIALKALGIKEGDEVIVPDFTMIATATAVSHCGATPVFVDVEDDTFNIDPDLIEEKITTKTKAIIPVHLYGQPCKMDEIRALADRYGLFVVEDAAEAHGAEYRGIRAGSIGDVGCFSFYANKIITTGEGGAITTNNKELADEMRMIRAFYFPKAGHFWHKKIGYNMRMSSLEAAYGLGQLERWNELINNRIKNAQRYIKHLKKYVDIPISVPNNKNVFWMFIIHTKYRDELMEFLEKKGIETRTGFTPCHLQPPYKENKEYPVSEDLAKKTMYLPSASSLTKKDQNKVIDAVKEYFEKNKIDDYNLHGEIRLPVGITYTLNPPQDLQTDYYNI